jgi:uncharacterized protein (TIGR02246 family)
MTAPNQSDEAEILALIDRWALAVRSEDHAAIRAAHDPHILMFDVPPPFASRGLDAYMSTWHLFFDHAPKPVTFTLEDIEVTASPSVAFATAKGRCISIDPHHQPEPLEFRLTIGLKKIDHQWRITHEHHSLPASN